VRYNQAPTALTNAQKFKINRHLDLLKLIKSVCSMPKRLMIAAILLLRLLRICSSTTSTKKPVTALVTDWLYGCFTDPYGSFTDGLGALQIGISLTRDL
jgi:hypothetical protein